MDITPRPGVVSPCLYLTCGRWLMRTIVVAHKERAASSLQACAARSCGHQSSRALGCLPAGGAGPTGGRGSRTSSCRGPTHGPRASGLALGEPVGGSNRSCRRGAAGDAVCIQRIPVAVLATPAATSYLRALVVVCKDPGRSMSFTVARRSTRRVRYWWTRTAGSIPVHAGMASDIHGLGVVVFDNFF